MQAFGQSHVAISDKRCYEACLFLIFFTKPDLMLAKKTIQECHHFTAYGKIDNIINSCDAEIILGVAFVQIGEVGTHLSFSILLLDHHHIYQPLRVSYFPNKTCINQSLNFGLYCFYFFFRYFLKLLLSGLCI
jgi:hypothetical protein